MPATDIRRFIDAHNNDHLSARAVGRAGGPGLLEEVIDGEVYLNLQKENPGRAFRIGVVFGALRATGMGLDTIMDILGDAE